MAGEDLWLSVTIDRHGHGQAGRWGCKMLGDFLSDGLFFFSKKQKGESFHDRREVVEGYIKDFRRIVEFWR